MNSLMLIRLRAWQTLWFWHTISLKVKLKANLGGCEHRCELKREEKFVHENWNKFFILFLSESKMASRNKSCLKSLIIVPALKGFYSQCRNCSVWAEKHSEDSTEQRPLIGVAAEHMKWRGRERWSSFTVTSCHTWKTMWDKAWRSFSDSVTSGSECLHCKTGGRKLS